MSDLRQRDDHRVRQALAQIRRDDEWAAPPSHLETLVMQAWEREQIRRRPAFQIAWFIAAAAAVIVIVVIAGRRASTPDSPAPGQAFADQPAGDARLITDDVLIDDELGSLQYVQLRMHPPVLSAFGVPALDPTDDRPVAVEVLIGIDGAPRAIRRADVPQE